MEKVPWGRPKGEELEHLSSPSSGVIGALRASRKGDQPKGIPAVTRTPSLGRTRKTIENLRGHSLINPRARLSRPRERPWVTEKERASKTRVSDHHRWRRASQSRYHLRGGVCEEV